MNRGETVFFGVMIFFVVMRNLRTRFVCFPGGSFSFFSRRRPPDASAIRGQKMSYDSMGTAW
jgi:hypothetical protein